MGKRSSGKFERNPRDYYKTPKKAVLPLIPHLGTFSNFAEPCAGDGQLIKYIQDITHMHQCIWASDIEPQVDFVKKLDALSIIKLPKDIDLIITNPPWNRKILHPMITHFRKQKPTWLLYDSDWMHTQQSREFMPYCHKIVSVGRVSWMENGKSGVDNSCWYLFKKEKAENTVFVGRMK